MTKTVVGLAVGHLLCDGDIVSLDDTLGRYSEGLANSVYADITIKNILRMASGVNENRNNEREYNAKLRNRYNDGSNDQLRQIQSVSSVYSDQGKVSRYHSLDVTAASILVTK